MKKIFLPLLVLLLLSSLAFAIQKPLKEGDIKLLAVTESGEGNVAALNLKVTEGTGRVFIDTKPLTKLDTLISTRFANTIACDFLDIDCSSYDFFYTITADSALVGGPSAGSAISVLTVAVLDNQVVPDHVAVTGTINSGGFIGSVGGIKAKVETAAENDLKLVLIPLGDSKYRENNTTKDLSQFADDLEIEVIEVSDLNTAMFEITGKKYWSDSFEINVPEIYTATMKALAHELCSKTKQLQKELLEQEVAEALPSYTSDEEKAINFTERSRAAFNNGSHYSAASYCYAANVIYRELLLRFANDTEISDLDNLLADISDFEITIDKKPIETITDLQAYMVVKERLDEAKDFLNLTYARLEDNDSEYPNEFSVAIERFYSAQTWSEFFGKPGKRFVFNSDSLKDSCDDKISEAEERFQYVNTILPFVHKSARTELERAYEDRDNENYVLCLFRAGKAKAETDVFINALGVEEEQQKLLIDNKINIAGKNIAKQITEDIFPILGYSYYVYAEDLKETDKYSALLFSEYALEMSNLNLYFEEAVLEKKARFQLSITSKFLLIFIAGILVGFAAGVLFVRYLKKSRRNKRRSKR